MLLSSDELYSQDRLTQPQLEGLALVLPFCTSMLHQCESRSAGEFVQYLVFLVLLLILSAFVDMIPVDTTDHSTELQCTYATTGNTFTEQHWYYCYTCKVWATWNNATKKLVHEVNFNATSAYLFVGLLQCVREDMPCWT